MLEKGQERGRASGKRWGKGVQFCVIRKLATLSTANGAGTLAETVLLFMIKVPGSVTTVYVCTVLTCVMKEVPGLKQFFFFTFITDAASPEVPGLRTARPRGAGATKCQGPEVPGLRSARPADSGGWRQGESEGSSVSRCY